jgi:hypothetical protein
MERSNRHYIEFVSVGSKIFAENVQTTQEQIKPKKLPFFKYAKGLQERVNEEFYKIQFFVWFRQQMDYIL